MSIHIFADDVQLLFTTPPGLVNSCVNNINTELIKLNEWAVCNGLTLNPIKSKAMIFNNTPISHLFDRINLNNVPLEYVSSAGSLGFVLDETLSFNQHVNSIISKVTFTLRRLYNLNHYLPRHIKIKLMHALIMPFFLYGPEIYSGTTMGNMDRLRVAYNSALRYTFGLRRIQHNLLPYSLRIIGTSFDKFIISRNLILLYKIVKLKTPSYMFHRLKFVSSPRLPGNLVVPMHSGSLMSKSFVVRNWRLWNHIDFKNEVGLNGFKVGLLEFRTKLLDFLNTQRIDEISGVSRYV